MRRHIVIAALLGLVVWTLYEQRGSYVRMLDSAGTSLIHLVNLDVVDD